jgi:hypothetical protein
LALTISELTIVTKVVDWGKGKWHTTPKGMCANLLKQDFEWVQEWLWYLNNVKVNTIESTLKVFDFTSKKGNEFGCTLLHSTGDDELLYIYVILIHILGKERCICCLWNFVNVFTFVSKHIEIFWDKIKRSVCCICYCEYTTWWVVYLLHCICICM